MGKRGSAAKAFCIKPALLGPFKKMLLVFIYSLSTIFNRIFEYFEFFEYFYFECSTGTSLIIWEVQKILMKQKLDVMKLTFKLSKKQ